MCEGIALELEGIQLGDVRLNRRSKQLIESLGANPEASINAACDGWSDTLAAYRFFDNPAVIPEKILQPHRDATLTRMCQQPVVLIVQDTTELDFSSHPPRDAKLLNKPDRFGLYDHTWLAVTPERLCLGVVGGEQFDREPDTLGQADERSTLPIEEKESLRWLTGYRGACELARECPDTRIVSVGDREADIYDIFVEAQRQQEQSAQLGPRAEFLVRARVERCLPKRAARTAFLEIRGISVTVKPPHARSHLPSVTMQIVFAREVGGLATARTSRGCCSLRCRSRRWRTRCSSWITMSRGGRSKSISAC